MTLAMNVLVPSHEDGYDGVLDSSEHSSSKKEWWHSLILCQCNGLPCTCHEFRNAFSQEETEKLSYHSAQTFAKKLYDMELLDIESLKRALWFLPSHCDCTETIDEHGTILHRCRGFHVS